MMARRVWRTAVTASTYYATVGRPSRPGRPGCSGAQTYGYDTASRLTSETITGDPSGASGDGALTYAIDAVGNRASRTSTLAALGAQSFSYDPNDELTSDGYDLNGNTTRSDGHTYGYDFENRLVSKDASAVTLVYDGDGNRVAKTASGATTQYLVDGLNPTGYLQVMDEISGGAVQVRYTYGNMLVSQTRTAPSAILWSQNLSLQPWTSIVATNVTLDMSLFGSSLFLTILNSDSTLSGGSVSYYVLDTTAL
jgi:YD repeat-containing protein